ncbi:MAG: arginase [Acidobacteria bacterium]|nr:MAG: arginase [Acidobacteriota bacterium]
MTMTIPPPRLPDGPPRPPRPLDPDAPGRADRGLFDLGLPLEECRVVAVPVPYEATCSGAAGTADGPRALVEASRDVDLHDPVAGEPYAAGIGALDEEPAIRRASRSARAAVADARNGDAAAAARADAIGRAVQEWVYRACRGLLATERLPVVLGGEHAVSVGAFRAAAERRSGIGILQIDAHPDLRPSYEGMATSHAAAMHAALSIEGVQRIVAVGLRDIAPADTRAREEAVGRCVWFTDAAIGAALAAGRRYDDVVAEVIEALPPDVWISLDMDGLEPALCPGTGTPVPGGLTWREFVGLVAAVGRSRRIVGADLVEIGPGRLDGLVAAKAFYLIAGVALAHRQQGAGP